MFERIQQFLQNLGGDRSRDFMPGDTHVAVVALCFHVMEADGTASSKEKKKLRALLSDRYKLQGSRLDALIEAGEDAGKEAVDYYRFTSDLRRHLSEEQRQEFIGILWDIVYADGARNEMEDHVIWRISDLLGVSARERITRRQQARAREYQDGEEEDLAD